MTQNYFVLAGAVEPLIGAAIVGVVLVVLFVVVIFSLGYVKAPPDCAYIISGLRKKPRVIIGKASVKVPFLERLDKLPLSLTTVDIKTQSPVPTAEYINIYVDGVANVKVSSKSEALERAAENFLNKDKKYLNEVAQQILEGNMREIVGQMKLSELVQNRDKFAQKVQENATKDMERMGLEIVNLTIQNFVDKNGIIEDLGMDNVTQIKKAAAIAKAEGERDIQIAQSNANQEANDARVNAETNIAEKNNELAIKQAKLKRDADNEKAVADSAYNIQKEEQRRSIEIAAQNANIAAKEKEVLLKEQEIQIKERMLDADIKKKAEAEKFAKQQAAEAELYARQKEAEAKKYEAEQEAQARIAQAEAFRVSEEKRAKGIEAVGIAEAKAIEMKAEAMKKMGEASIIDMYLQALPEMVKNAAAPLAKTDKIVMYGDGNASKIIADVMSSSNQVTEGLKEATGIDIAQLISSFSGQKVEDTSDVSEESVQEQDDQDYTEVEETAEVSSDIPEDHNEQ